MKGSQGSLVTIIEGSSFVGNSGGAIRLEQGGGLFCRSCTFNGASADGEGVSHSDKLTGSYQGEVAMSTFISSEDLDLMVNNV